MLTAESECKALVKAIRDSSLPKLLHKDEPSVHMLIHDLFQNEDHSGEHNSHIKVTHQMFDHHLHLFLSFACGQIIVNKCSPEVSLLVLIYMTCTLLEYIERACTQQTSITFCG